MLEYICSINDKNYRLHAGQTHGEGNILIIIEMDNIVYCIVEYTPCGDKRFDYTIIENYGVLSNWGIEHLLEQFTYLAVQ